jgi:hypothetical protein
MAEEPAIVTSTVTAACAFGTMDTIAVNNSTAKIDFISDIAIDPSLNGFETISLHVRHFAARRKITAC